MSRCNNGLHPWEKYEVNLPEFRLRNDARLNAGVDQSVKGGPVGRVEAELTWDWTYLITISLCIERGAGLREISTNHKISYDLSCNISLGK